MSLLNGDLASIAGGLSEWRSSISFESALSSLRLEKLTLSHKKKHPTAIVRTASSAYYRGPVDVSRICRNMNYQSLSKTDSRNPQK